MAAHLEAQPGARAVVNFTPVLIEQLQELAAAHRLSTSDRGHALPDPVLALLRSGRSAAGGRSSGSSSCAPACARSART